MQNNKWPMLQANPERHNINNHLITIAKSMFDMAISFSPAGVETKLAASVLGETMKEKLSAFYKQDSGSQVRDGVRRFLNSALENHQQTQYNTPEEILDGIDLSRFVIQTAAKNRLSPQEASLHALVAANVSLNLFEKVAGEVFTLKKDALANLPNEEDSGRLKADLGSLKQELKSSLRGELTKLKTGIEGELTEVYQDIMTEITSVPESRYEDRREIQRMRKEIKRKKEKDEDIIEDQKKLKEKITEFEKNEAEFRSSLNTASHVVNGMAAIIGFIDPELGSDINTVGTAAISIVSGVSTIMAATTAGAAFGGIGAVVGAVAGVISYFGNKNKPSAQQVILQQIAAISKQIANMHQNILERFDKLDKELDAIFNTMTSYHQELLKQFESLHERFDELQGALAEQTNLIIQINAQYYDKLYEQIARFETRAHSHFKVLFSQEFEQTYEYMLDYHGIYPNATSSEIRAAYNEFIGSFYRWARRGSISRSLTGGDENNFSINNMYRLLNESSYPLGTLVQYLMSFLKSHRDPDPYEWEGELRSRHDFALGGRALIIFSDKLSRIGDVINPIVWAEGINAYIQLRQLFPMQTPVVKSKLGELAQLGYDFEMFTEVLSKNKELWRFLKLNLLNAIYDMHSYFKDVRFEASIECGINDIRERQRKALADEKRRQAWTLNYLIEDSWLLSYEFRKLLKNYQGAKISQDIEKMLFVPSKLIETQSLFPISRGAINHQYVHRLNHDSLRVYFIGAMSTRGLTSIFRDLLLECQEHILAERLGLGTILFTHSVHGNSDAWYLTITVLFREKERDRKIFMRDYEFNYNELHRADRPAVFEQVNQYLVMGETKKVKADFWGYNDAGKSLPREKRTKEKELIDDSHRENVKAEVQNTILQFRRVVLEKYQTILKRGVLANSKYTFDECQKKVTVAILLIQRFLAIAFPISSPLHYELRKKLDDLLNYFTQYKRSILQKQLINPYEPIPDLSKSKERTGLLINSLFKNIDLLREKALEKPERHKLVQKTLKHLEAQITVDTKLGHYGNN